MNNIKLFCFTLLLVIVQTQTQAQRFSSVSIAPASAIIELGSGETLKIGFDDLNDESLTLRYRLQHCNPDFKPSGLKDQEFATGINEVDIPAPELSFNTRVNYVHYGFEFPDNQVQPRVSGNYLIQIYDVDNPSEYLLEIPIRIYENKTTFDASVMQPRRVEYSRTKQELNITAQVDPSIPVANTANLLLLVKQNQNIYTTRDIPLRSSNGNYLEYRYDDALVFDGLNEFRNFDIRPITYTARGVLSTDLIDGTRHITLYTDKSYKGYEYADRDDINGQFAIKAAGLGNSDLEGDYAMVHFMLASPYIPNKDVYVMGDFTCWQKLPQYKMNYNSGKGEYQLDLPVKQGFYDYVYNVSSGESDNDFVNFENTFFDTENTYFIYLYYMRPGEINYRLIGYRQVNSVR